MKKRMSRCLFKSELDKSVKLKTAASRHLLCLITAALFNDERQKLAFACRKAD